MSSLNKNRKGSNSWSISTKATQNIFRKPVTRTQIKCLSKTRATEPLQIWPSVNREGKTTDCEHTTASRSLLHLSRRCCTQEERYDLTRWQRIGLSSRKHTFQGQIDIQNPNSSSGQTSGSYLGWGWKEQAFYVQLCGLLCINVPSHKNGLSPKQKGFLWNHTTLFSTKSLEKSLCDFTGTIFVQCGNPVLVHPGHFCHWWKNLNVLHSCLQNRVSKRIADRVVIHARHTHKNVQVDTVSRTKRRWSENAPRALPLTMKDLCSMWWWRPLAGKWRITTEVGKNWEIGNIRQQKKNIAHATHFKQAQKWEKFKHFWETWVAWYMFSARYNFQETFLLSENKHSGIFGKEKQTCFHWLASCSQKKRPAASGVSDSAKNLANRSDRDVRCRGGSQSRSSLTVKNDWRKTEKRSRALGKLGAKGTPMHGNARVYGVRWAPKTIAPFAKAVRHKRNQWLGSNDGLFSQLFPNHKEAHRAQLSPSQWVHLLWWCLEPFSFVFQLAEKRNFQLAGSRMCCSACFADFPVFCLTRHTSRPWALSSSSVRLSPFLTKRNPPGIPSEHLHSGTHFVIPKTDTSKFLCTGTSNSPILPGTHCHHSLWHLSFHTSRRKKWYNSRRRCQCVSGTSVFCCFQDNNLHFDLDSCCWESRDCFGITYLGAIVVQTTTGQLLL